MKPLFDLLFATQKFHAHNEARNKRRLTNLIELHGVGTAIVMFSDLATETPIDPNRVIGSIVQLNSALSDFGHKRHYGRSKEESGDLIALTHIVGEMKRAVYALIMELHDLHKPNEFIRLAWTLTNIQEKLHQKILNTQEIPTYRF